ncbi:lasso peptide biosynthesis B2 protein [Novosphingobium sp. TCA1]|uniref:lasso peptide biosynthesis B2 protein n=1 Tax=Novosphingobium sp. TCA1 TaxID=2682474 RepID=UPI00135AF28D|nr:lasso peptide biosynthesis B2 protein [Novosphingobium sp. TCA1]
MFLDLAADRYFCLSPRLEAAFRSILSDAGDAQRTDDAAPLLLSGLLAEVPGPTAVAPCLLPSRARTSFLDAPREAARPLAIGMLAVRISLARFALRIGRLHRMISGLSECKAAIRDTRKIDEAAMRDLASQFARTARLTQAHDRCLPRSLALARYALARGWPVDLVMGVHLRPFAAHCWVQAGTDLLNDRLDNVRPFTPILVV